MVCEDVVESASIWSSVARRYRALLYPTICYLCDMLILSGNLIQDNVIKRQKHEVKTHSMLTQVENVEALKFKETM